VTSRPLGHVLHALLDPLHAPRRGPALEEVDALARLLPDRPRESFLQITAEKVDPLFAPAETDALIAELEALKPIEELMVDRKIAIDMARLTPLRSLWPVSRILTVFAVDIVPSTKIVPIGF